MQVPVAAVSHRQQGGDETHGVARTNNTLIEQAHLTPDSLRSSSSKSLEVIVQIAKLLAALLATVAASNLASMLLFLALLLSRSVWRVTLYCRQRVLHAARSHTQVAPDRGSRSPRGPYGSPFGWQSPYEGSGLGPDDAATAHGVFSPPSSPRLGHIRTAGQAPAHPSSPTLMQDF